LAAADCVKYAVKYASAVPSDLKGLSRDVLRRLDARIDEIEANPFDLRISKLLKGGSGLRSSRVGDWRILYAVHYGCHQRLRLARFSTRF
jgi:mRNA interferase RelE/StbE